VVGPASVKVTVEPRSQLQGELPTAGFAAATGSASTWAVSWSQLILLFLLALVAAGFLSHRRRARSGGPSRPVRREATPAAAPAS
jgi:hypothetical protein